MSTWSVAWCHSFAGVIIFGSLLFSSLAFQVPILLWTRFFSKKTKNLVSGSSWAFNLQLKIRFQLNSPICKNRRTIEFPWQTLLSVVGNVVSAKTMVQFNYLLSSFQHEFLLLSDNQGCDQPTMTRILCKVDHVPFNQADTIVELYTKRKLCHLVSS